MVGEVADEHFLGRGKGGTLVVDGWREGGDRKKAYGCEGDGEGGVVADLGDVFVYLEDFFDAGDWCGLLARASRRVSGVDGWLGLGMVRGVRGRAAEPVI